jgi:hypothetical protein
MQAEEEISDTIFDQIAMCTQLSSKGAKDRKGWNSGWWKSLQQG